MPAETIFRVLVSHESVELEILAPDHSDYDDARQKVILRERDAIQLHQNLEEQGERKDGAYAFLSAENAKSFALLRLKSMEQTIEDNLDRIQAFGSHG